MNSIQAESNPRNRFAGVFPANPTPVTDNGDIHEKGLRAVLEDNMAYGVHGFWVAGTSGEGPYCPTRKGTLWRELPGRLPRVAPYR